MCCGIVINTFCGFFCPFRSGRNHKRPTYKEESGSENEDEDYAEEEEDGSDEEFVADEEVDEKSKGRVRGDKETPRKRKSASEVVSTEEVVIPKKRLKRLERKIVSNDEEKFSIEELMETNTYQRFTRLVENIFDATEDADLNAAADLDNDTDAPQEAMIPKQQLHELCAEAAKLKVNISILLYSLLSISISIF